MAVVFVAMNTRSMGWMSERSRIEGTTVGWPVASSAPRSSMPASRMRAARAGSRTTITVSMCGAVMAASEQPIAPAPMMATRRRTGLRQESDGAVAGAGVGVVTGAA